MSNQVYATLVLNDEYVPGALVVGASLREVSELSSPYKRICLVGTHVSQQGIDELEKVFHELISIPHIVSTDFRLSLLNRPQLAMTYSKIHLWALTQFSKIVYLDADTMILKDISDLFARPELSAAPDVGWPDCFNSGLFVCEPNMKTFNDLKALISTEGSFDGADQGLLNQYFSNWASNSETRLPFVYNVVASASYAYIPAYLKFKDDIKVFHFIGENKPWLHRYEVASGPINEMKGKWWRIYESLAGTTTKVTTSTFKHAESFPYGSLPSYMNPDETRTNYIPPPRDEFQKKFSEYKVDWAPIEEKIITPEEKKSLTKLLAELDDEIVSVSSELDREETEEGIDQLTRRIDLLNIKREGLQRLLSK